MTQHELILAYLMEREWITPMDAFLNLGITKLATRIGELKKLGYGFDQQMMRQKNRYGKWEHHMSYRLKGEEAQQ